MQSVLQTKGQHAKMKDWIGANDIAHSLNMRAFENELQQQERTRYVRLKAKMRAIDDDVSQGPEVGCDPQRGNLQLTLKAMRASAAHEVLHRKLDVHKKHGWYFQLVTILNSAEEGCPLFSRAEEQFMERLKDDAEAAGGGLTLQILSRAAAEARGLNPERDGVRLIVECCLNAVEVPPGEELPQLLDKLMKTIHCIESPTRTARTDGKASVPPAASRMSTNVATDANVVTTELDGHAQDSFYLTAAPAYETVNE